MGNCTSSLETLPIPNGGSVQEMFSKALSSKDISEEHLEKLIASKVDVNYKMEHDTIGSCYPIHLAANVENLKAVQLLLKAGADPNLRDMKGQTALHWAVQKQNIDIIKELLENNADPKAAAEDGTAPIHLTIQDENEEILELLIQRGASPNAEEAGPAPLVTAVKGKSEKMIIALLKAGATPSGLDFEFPEGETKTLASWAQDNDFNNLVQWLEENLSSSEETPAIEEMEKEIEEANTNPEPQTAEEGNEESAPPPAEDQPSDEAAVEEVEAGEDIGGADGSEETAPSGGDGGDGDGGGDEGGEGGEGEEKVEEVDGGGG